MKKHVPYETIEAAIQGDIIALEEILMHYERYISTLATHEFVDKSGQSHFYVDLELKHRLESKLVAKIFKFKAD